MHRRPFLLLGSLFLGLVGCATTSQSYLKATPGYSVIRGEILNVEGLAAQEFQQLADGVVIKITQPGCRVTLLLGKKNEQVYEVGPGTILVLGDKADFLLRDEIGATP